MNQRTLAITAILAASILSVVAISTPMAFADESETVIEQEQRQENVEVLNHLMTTVVRT
jgi:FlaG/FlaF family flagellin (archaellin)